MEDNVKKGLIAALMVLFTTNVFAAPVGIPNKLKSLSSMTDISNGELDFHQGFEFDFMSKDLDKYDAELDVNFYKAKLGVTIADNYDIILGIGTSDEAEYSESDGSYVNPMDDDIVYSLGLSAIITEFEDSGLSLYAAYNYLNYSNVSFEREFTRNGGKASWSSWVDIDADYVEWQLALGIAKSVEFELGDTAAIWVPYAGFKYSDAELEINSNIASTATLDADENFGVFLGSSLTLNENISFDIEGRLGDEQSINFGFQVKL